MRITRIYTGPDHQSHFEDIEVALGEAELGRLTTGALPAQSFGLRETPAVHEVDFHPAPQRQLVVTIQGVLEVELGDGTKRRFRLGELLLADDTTGQGHRSRNIAGTRRSVIVGLGPDFDLDKLRK